MSRHTLPESFSLLAPISGVLVPLAEVPDAVFAQRLAGDGISIDPVSTQVLAPCDGRVVQVHRAAHAVTLDVAGLEVVIHVGLDTVALRGAGFTPRVRAGDRVAAGDVLLDFDADAVARRARSLLTQMVVANVDRVRVIRPRTGVVVAARDAVMDVVLAGPIEADGRAGDEGTAQSSAVRVQLESGLHARPAAVLAAAARRFASNVRLVRGGREANVRSLVSIMALEVAHGDTVFFRASGVDADAAVSELVRVLAALKDEPPSATVSAPGATAVTSAPANELGLLRGVAASPGVAVGRIYHFQQDEVAVEEHAADPNHERRELDAAIAAAHLQLEALQRRMSREADAARAAIFAAHQELLEDPDVLDRAAAAIREGASAAFAWRQAYREQAQRLVELRNPLLAARATDLRDLGRRVLHLLVGRDASPQEIPDGSIVIAEDLTPSDTAALDRTHVRGICTTMGSATSHAAILARGLGIPAVAGIDVAALALPAGTPAILDGDRGTLRPNPDAAEEASARQRREQMEQRRRAERAAALQPATTRDGHRVEVVANLGDVADAPRVVEAGGEGVGLLRTEFLFMDRQAAPTEEEQEEAYGRIADALGPERILVIRTLDVGGDKPLPYIAMATEANPFLGERGVRMTLARPELFRSQVRAILRASRRGRVALMFPMVATLAEWRAARALVEEERARLGLPALQIGIMVETAAAALLAEQYAREADFFSIGTNDLTQYTLAMDRTNPRLAPQVDALHPAILKLIDMTVRGAHAHRRWVGVCGALAGDPAAVPVLLGLGVDELSADLPLVPAVKARVRSLDFEQCAATAREALDAPDGAAVRSLVEQRHG